MFKKLENLVMNSVMYIIGTVAVIFFMALGAILRDTLFNQ